jgi:hypothetical protein
MRKIATLGSVCVLLLGCGGSSTELVLGDSLAIRVDETPSGRSAVTMKLGLRSCRPAKVAVAWGGDDPMTLLARGAQETCCWDRPVPA